MKYFISIVVLAIWGVYSLLNDLSKVNWVDYEETKTMAGVPLSIKVVDHCEEGTKLLVTTTCKMIVLH